MKQAIKKSDGSRVAVKMVDKVEGIVVVIRDAKSNLNSADANSVPKI